MILVNKIWQLAVGPALIYRVMRELGIQSRMVQKRKKPKTYTEVEQRPNLIKKRTDKTKVLLTDITYIPIRNKWVYLASLYELATRRVVAQEK